MTAAPIALGRLTRRAEFLRAAAGRKSAAAGLVLQARVAEDGGTAMRVGFTASKKVGGAVERNRAKRRLREIARAVLPARAAPGYDYVLIARAETVARPFADLRTDLGFALKRLGLLRVATESPA